VRAEYKRAAHFKQKRNQDLDEGKTRTFEDTARIWGTNDGGTNWEHGLEQKQRTETGSQTQAGKILDQSLDGAKP
jgi:hypothetical protein